MRPRRLAFVAALALALAACTGGEPPPDASPADEAPSTPAPTAIAAAEASPPPSPAPTPEPPPEVACANGVAVEEPEVRPGLVADCVALLASRDALRGEASLDWGGHLAIGRWEGVAVGGEPPRVTGLDLRGKGLTGSIPRTLGGLTELTDLRLAGNRLAGVIPEWLGGMQRLSTLILVDNALAGGIPRPIGRLPLLSEVRLAGNALTGCVPSAFGDARGDALYLGLPWCLRYDRLDATGEAAEAGGWAVLGASGEVLATWEGLRSEAATLRVHQTDAAGTSWAPEFGAVSEGGLFEWRKASDCWVRYHVTGPPVRPAAGSGRWEFPVEWMTYAATGEGCTGAVGSSAVLGADEAPTAFTSIGIAAPVRHGPWLLRPLRWAGTLETQVQKQDVGGEQGQSEASQFSVDIDVVKRHPFWRDPDLPPGWRLDTAVVAYEGIDGYLANYTDARGGWGVDIQIRRLNWAPLYIAASDKLSIWEARIIDGHPAVVHYSPWGDLNRPTYAFLYDRSRGIEYRVIGISPRIGGSADAVIRIVRSLLPSGGAS